jgi:Protein of unknown function (DUF1559)
MTPSTPPPDRSFPLTRRDLLRLGAAAAGVLLVAQTMTDAVAGGQSTRVDSKAAPPADGPALPGDDHPEARARTVENLLPMGIAMQNFAFRNGGRFPPAAIRKGGEPLLSWRVAVLPFLDEKALYARFHLDEPWDSAHNKTLQKEMPLVYAPVVRNDTAPYSTYYQGLVGPGALFDGEEGTRIADVTDGVAWTVMIVEAAQPVPWTKPEDVPYDKARPLPKLGGQFDDGVYVAFADGSARFLSRGVDSDTLHALITRGDGRVITFDQLGPWRRVR